MNIEDLIGKVEVYDCEGVDKALLLISEREKEFSEKLEVSLSRQCQIESRMSKIGRSLASVNIVSNYSKKLNDQITRTSSLATVVSVKVRQLDLARSRASECQKRVHDLIDLQLCSQGVLKAISNEDYEKGASHINRFLAMDKKLLQRTADDVQDAVTSVSEAVITLEKATASMRDIISQRFNDAVKSDDLASVERFFKIFPLLGLHKEGIQKFSDYICSKLSTKAQKELRSSLDIAKSEKRSSLAYADTLTTLLENFARVIEVNQPLIENYYGNGYLLHMVKILQNECDVEVRNLILEFNKNRKIVSRVQQINESHRNMSGTGSHGLDHYRKPSGGSIDKLNAKDIDAIIAEITIMHSRSELFFRFVRRRVTIDSEASTSDVDLQKQKSSVLDSVLVKSDFSRQMQELLSTYLLLERYFMEESVLKAISLDAYESGQQCSSMVDDVFFILRKSIQRSFTTQSVNGTCAVINNAAACLDGDFVNALKSALKNGYSSGYIDLAQAYNAIQTTLQQGKIQTSDVEKARLNFLIQLNNADISTEYIETLWQTINQEINAKFPAVTAVETQLLQSCTGELKSVRHSLKACVDFGLQQLRSSALKPRLHPWVDQFLNYNHYLTEEELSAYEANETYVQFLIMQIDNLLNSFKNVLTSRNYDALVSIVATEVTIRLERAIKKSTFNRLGGIVLDQEVRSLGTYLTSATSWSVRDKMTRLTQIAILLNLEKVSELSDYWNPENSAEMPSWRLTSSEVRTILTLRSDFRMEDIKRIQL